MKAKLFKNLVTTISFIILISNCSPLFAQIIEIQILGGGYKLRGPSQINLPSQSSSSSENIQSISFRDLASTTPEESLNSYLLVIDENGGNPFDVTVSAGELKKIEPLTTTTISGSTDTQIKVASSTGFSPGDNITITENELALEAIIYTIDSIPDSTTISLAGSLGFSPPENYFVSRIVDCQVNPRKCIPLTNFAISNWDQSGSEVETVNGNANDFSVNSQTTNPTPFIGASTTIAGSTGNTLKVEDAFEFIVGESIKFPSDSGVSPLYFTINNITDANTIVLDSGFASAPESGIRVESTSARTLTLGNGTGESPGQWKIFPTLQSTIPAGQIPGVYQTTLTINIV